MNAATTTGNDPVRATTTWAAARTTSRAAEATPMVHRRSSTWLVADVDRRPSPYPMATTPRALLGRSKARRASGHPAPSMAAGAANARYVTQVASSAEARRSVRITGPR